MIQNQSLTNSEGSYEVELYEDFINHLIFDMEFEGEKKLNDDILYSVIHH